MKCAVDGDIIVYAIANLSDGHARKEALANSLPFEPEPVAHVLHSVKLSLQSLIDKFDEYQVYLSGPSETNFRFKVYDKYKANRPTEKPHHWKNCRDYLITQWGAKVCHGEADDELGKVGAADWADACQAADFFGHASDPWAFCQVTVASIDKDLLMIPGIHYNWRKDETTRVSGNEGMRFFCKQLLTGDSVDNIPGLAKVGDKTAEHILGKVDHVFSGTSFTGDEYAIELFKEVVREYARRKEPLSNLSRAADLLWILQGNARGSEVIKTLISVEDTATLWKRTADDKSEKPTAPPRRPRARKGT